MAFIIRHTSGIVCAPLAPEEARRLHLDPMVELNDAPLGTAFTVSVDVIHELGKHADRRQTGEAAEIDAGLGVARAHEHSAVLRHQRKHVAGPYEIRRTAVAVGERATVR
jgi:hypothetical protein